MARMITSGFELGAPGNPNQGALYLLNPDGFDVPAFSTTTTTTGARAPGLLCLRCNPSAAQGSNRRFMPTMPALGQSIFIRTYLRVDSLPSTTTGVLSVDNTGATSGVAGQTVSLGVHLYVDTSGALVLDWGDGSSQNIVGTSSALSTGTYYRVEVSISIGTGSVDSVSAQIDGVQFASASGLAITDAWFTSISIGAWVASGTTTCDISHDDFAVNNSTTASNNTFPGAGNIVLLKPTGDSAKGTGWTDDNASTTSLFPSVESVPPAGIADTTAGGGGHQIRNATSNANVNYDANLTTYTAAGIGASDTINLVDPIIATSAPVATSAKAGTVGVVSNPAIANVSLGATGTSGAFWGGTTAGTYETGWKWSHGTVTLAPTVTKGTAPVMRVTQVTASTRIAMVCAMGLYVDYTPAVIATKAPPFQSRTARNFLLRR